jgi:hypothetical protein
LRPSVKDRLLQSQHCANNGGRFHAASGCCT